MTTSLNAPTEQQHLLGGVPHRISNPNQPTGKYRWIIASVVSLGGIGGVSYVSVKSFIAGATANGVILGAGTLICAGACAYCMYRFVDSFRNRNIEQVDPVIDLESARTNTLMLRNIHVRLNALIIQPIYVDGAVDNEIINQQLTKLETEYALMQEELEEFQQIVQTELANRSRNSPSMGGLDSPSVEGTFESRLSSRLNALAKLSRNSSRLQSAYNSPITGGTGSSLSLVSPIKNLKAPKLDFFKTINTGSDSDSDDKDGRK